MPYHFPKQAIMEALTSGIVDGLDAVAVRFQRGMIEILSQKGLGQRAVFYYTDKRGRRRKRLGQPRSLPGDPPAAQTGTLKRSWQYAKLSARVIGDRAVANVSTNVEYAPWLEYGTRRGLKPRPSVRPVVAAVERVAASIIDDRVRRRLARFNGGGR